MEIVTNTSSMIFIAKLDLFYLAKNIFSKILVPKQVIEEIFEKESPENILIKKELENFLLETGVKEIKNLFLDEGEKAAISLCLEKNIKILLSDDKKARAYAKNLGIDVIGVAGILIKNTEKNKIKKQEAKKILNKLIEHGYYISPYYFSKIMQEIDKY